MDLSHLSSDEFFFSSIMVVIHKVQLLVYTLILPFILNMILLNDSQYMYHIKYLLTNLESRLETMSDDYTLELDYAFLIFKS